MVNRVDLSIIPGCVSEDQRPQAHPGQVSSRHHQLREPAEQELGSLGQRLINGSILTNPGADATGKLTYNLQNLSGKPDHHAAAGRTPASRDIYVMMLSFRYTF